VATIIVRKRAIDFNHLYWMSRHFVWLIPLINLVLFLLLGLALWVVSLVWARRGRWIAMRSLGAFTLLAPIWAASSRLYGPAGFLLAVGFSARLVPVIEQHADGFRRLVRFSLPLAAALVPVLAASLWSADLKKAWSEVARPLPPASAPNVLLIVLDTVGAEHLHLYGSGRSTSQSIDELAARGIRFDQAQATSSWTLPSHASMFTGRWPHELSAGWFTPLDGTLPTLAEFVGSHGYATAGFIANTWYCARDSGLGRGFTHYRDFRFPRLTALRTAALVDRPLEGIVSIERFLEDWLDLDLFSAAVDRLYRLLKLNRKEAETVNREFFDWLSHREQSERPFFAFLNFYDAHYPYELPELGIHRFGAKARSGPETAVVRDWPRVIQHGPSPGQVTFGRDAYDDCVANLDEHLGRLIDELKRRRVLDRTWVIITADHGESFGENPGVFWHGTSLYQAQLHVPLVIVPPAGGPPAKVVTETVSLRDLAATVGGLVGLEGDSPFPGESLSRFWDDSPTAQTKSIAVAHPASLGQALSEVVPLESFGADPSQSLGEARWPLAALTEGDLTYIRREGDVKEELFRVRGDAPQRRNLTADPSMQDALQRMRSALSRLTGGPLTPARFNP
jgi:arylsulfatase A-like enzyme